MIRNLNKKYLFISTLLIYFFIGSYLSLTTGISSDEYHEQSNWIINLSAIKEFLSTGQYDSFLTYWDRYHGIAFHLISQPIQFLLRDIVIDLNGVSEYGAQLIAKPVDNFMDRSSPQPNVSRSTCYTQSQIDIYHLQCMRLPYLLTMNALANKQQ